MQEVVVEDQEQILHLEDQVEVEQVVVEHQQLLQVQPTQVEVEEVGEIQILVVKPADRESLF
jgi:hypothetical protein